MPVAHCLTAGADVASLPYSGFSGGGFDNSNEEDYTYLGPAATCSNMGAVITISASESLLFRKNAVSGNQTLSVNSTGYVQDGTHSDSVVATDLIGSYRNGLSNCTTTVRSLQVDGTSATAVVYGFSMSANDVESFVTSARYNPMFGGNANTGTFPDGDMSKTVLFSTGTISDFMLRVVVASSGTATVNVRRNGVNGNSGLSIPPSTTGNLQDTTHTDSVAQGDDYNVQSSSTGGDGQWKTQVVTFSPSASGQDFSACDNGDYQTGSTGYFPASGYLHSGLPAASEAAVRIDVPYALVASHFCCRLWATSTATLNFRANGANGNQVLSPASAIGVVYDSTHEDTLAKGDGMDYLITPTGTTYLSQVGSGILKDASAPAASTTGFFHVFP